MLAACGALRTLDRAPGTPTAARYSRVEFADIPGWRDDRLREAWPAWLAACGALPSLGSRRIAWSAPCARSRDVDTTSDDAVRAFFEREFTPYRIESSDGNADGLVTGYYEPRLNGSRTRHDRFQTPLHRPPADLVRVELAELFPQLANARVRGRIDGARLVPYWTRAEIVARGAALDENAIVFVDDRVAAFFMEVQGSGRVSLDDGTLARLAYADQNGHPYRAIGRVLVERGEIARDDVSLQSIVAWTLTHPASVDALLAENPSYVFFREVEASADPAAGPPGSLGVSLVPERSVAVDPRNVPLGAPVFISTTRPSNRTALERLVVALDTGGAIRGAVRFDYFWGTGDDAAREAGLMKERGRAWLLWPRDAPLELPKT